MFSNKKYQQILRELFIEDKNQTLLWLSCYFALTRSIAVNCTHYFIIKSPNKEQIAFKHT